MSILKSYLKRLTNLSTRNRSLVLPALPAEQFLDIDELDFLNNRPSFEIIKQLIAQKNEIKLCDVVEPRHEQSNEVSKRLKKIARTQKFIEEERGAEDLYVGWPFVQGKLLDGTPIHGPLLFFAVELLQENNKWLLKKRAAPTCFNRSLLLAYAHFSQTNIANDFLETNLSELDQDPLVFRTQLYELLKMSELALNFNSEIFTDKLQPFSNFKTTDLEILEQNGELRLMPEAVLGIFPQAGSYLTPDYNALIGLDYQFDLGLDNAQETVSKLKEEHIVTVFPLDASQEKALRMVKSGQSLVVQGPPGTGKSQLIANLISDFAARGKRVLLVCQKRVALDVVHDRLKSVGMAQSVALIHDFRNDRPKLYAQIAHQIEQVEDYKRQNYSLDTVFLERTFTLESRRIDQVVVELEAFKTALFDTSICGLSIKELYLSSTLANATVDLSAHYQYFQFDEKLNTFLENLRNYQQYVNHLEPPHPWAVRTDFSRQERKNMIDIEAVVQEIDLTKLQLNECLKTPKLANIKLAVAEVSLLEIVLENLKDAQTVPLFHQMLVDNYVFPQHSTQRESILQKIQKYVSSDLLEKTLLDKDLVISLAQTEQAVLAKRSLMGQVGWFFSKSKSKVKSLLIANNLRDQLDDLLVLKQKIENRIDLQTIAQLHYYQSLDVDVNELKIEVIDSEFERINCAERAVIVARKIKFLAIDLPTEVSSLAFVTGLKKQRTFWKSIEQRLPRWELYLSDFQVNNIILAEDKQYADSLVYSLKSDFDLLVEADVLRTNFETKELQIINLWVSGDFATVVLNALKLGWINHIEERHPILKGVSSLKISQLEQQLQESIAQKQQLSQAILLMHLREKTYKDLVFNRLNNAVTYRELNHQVTKKKKIWPIRKLLENHADTIFQLVPCWMASPESVSAVFPLESGLFDLVIFDEASQCFVENAVPSIFRAKQILITGDSKQLIPSDLYRIRFEDDADSGPQLEIDSLLDLAAQTLPQTTLRSHYRSQSLALIAFSNQYFYKNQLQMLPHFEAINNNESSIEFIKTDGVWHNNTNQIEAERVVLLVKTFKLNTPALSIGVVTFNFQQQKLIEELLNDESVFVKNIENVQGDERDIIVFSVGYAPDLRGKMTMNFGTLNTQGGENRLNVAITRAKQKVVVVASILPQQLQTDNAQNEGPKLLKKYLEYATQVSTGRFDYGALVGKSYKSGLLLADKIVDNQEFLKLESKNISKELPFADLTVKQHDLYESLILTDDDLYLQSQTVKEPHGYLPIDLRAKRWPFQRIYSREIWLKS